ncbi:hypothetical protein, partial [Streptomyces anthocyanicus]
MLVELLPPPLPAGQDQLDGAAGVVVDGRPDAAVGQDRLDQPALLVPAELGAGAGRTVRRRRVGAGQQPVVAVVGEADGRAGGPGLGDDPPRSCSRR